MINTLYVNFNKFFRSNIIAYEALSDTFIAFKD